LIRLYNKLLLWDDFNSNCPAKNTENHSTSTDRDNKIRAHLWHVVAAIVILFISFLLLIEYAKNSVLCIYSETGNKHSIDLAILHRSECSRRSLW